MKKTVAAIRHLFTKSIKKQSVQKKPFRLSSPPAEKPNAIERTSETYTDFGVRSDERPSIIYSGYDADADDDVDTTIGKQSGNNAKPISRGDLDAPTRQKSILDSGKLSSNQNQNQHSDRALTLMEKKKSRLDFKRFKRRDP